MTNHRRLDDRQSLERARHELKKKSSGRFQRSSGRVSFSDEGGFIFSEAPFKGTLHEGLKGASPSKASSREGAARGLQEGFKGASKGLERGLKPSTLKEASRA